MPRPAGTTIIVIWSFMYPDNGLQLARAIQVIEPNVNNPMISSIGLNKRKPMTHKNKPRAIKMAPKEAISGRIRSSLPYTASI